MNFSLNMTALYTIIRKEIIRVLRIWIQTILPSVITMFLYITIFGNFIGDKIGSIKEFSYIEYIIPGLIIIPIICFLKIITSDKLLKFNAKSIIDDSPSG